MTTERDDRMARVERALAEAYRARGERPVGPSLAAQVMQEIRRAAGARGADHFPGLEQLVWRTAAFAAAVAAVVAVVWGGAVVGPARDTGVLFGDEIEIASLFGED